MVVASILPTCLPSLSRPHSPTPKPKSQFRYVSPRMSSLPSSPDPLTAIGRLLWGGALPPQPLVGAARATWTATWHLMMRQLAPSGDSAGSYSRPPSAFPTVPDSYRNSASSSCKNSRRLHLYVGLPCPWAHRTLIVRALKNLEAEVGVSVAAPGADGSWEFADAGGVIIYAGLVSALHPGPDQVNGRRTLREVYRMRSKGYDGRSTVPMLWDVERREVICNESYGIIEFFNSEFCATESGGQVMDLAPLELKQRIKEWNQIIYPNVNNGVYRCGFAQSQGAYDAAVDNLFRTLDMLDAHLATSRYLCGDVLTLVDVCLFTTLIRFDLAYNILFKCSKKKLVEYTNLHAYTRDIYQIPKVADTCNFEAIMDGYYRTLFPLNPGGIQPIIPAGCETDCLNKPHNRQLLSKVPA